MKYTIQRLDGRYTHKDLFQYYIGFTNRMNTNKGPLFFCQVQQWFMETYGFSAEIRQYADILKWNQTHSTLSFAMARKFGGHPLFQQGSTEQVDTTNICNPHWSWTNGYDDLRIYVAGDAELTFFQLKFQVDSKHH